MGGCGHQPNTGWSNTPKLSSMPSALAVFTCRPNSHPFQERHVYLDEPVKIGRSVARCRPAQSNATFDCKVLSRNHALVWFDHQTGKGPQREVLAAAAKAESHNPDQPRPAGPPRLLRLCARDHAALCRTEAGVSAAPSTGRTFRASRGGVRCRSLGPRCCHAEELV
ncbi:hypothetical protein SKAU_G00175580 [Synaphobranchus kaupii]|uniref:FHA domain-containing protein n=1 Tax=Synaphobranchus kaupii TaxID=118154 RepID=A0A9Q1FLL5_SYNKA|nr:hypothetical protein SKAU_G00175580 [Synaphobranchus kaupii]